MTARPNAGEDGSAGVLSEAVWDKATAALADLQRASAGEARTSGLAGTGESDIAGQPGKPGDAGQVVLACHLSPDGDALGSMLALALALRRRGVAATASFSEPFEIPDSLSTLPGLDLLVPPEAVPRRPELMVTFDTGSVDRLGGLADRVDGAAEVLVIDHHASNTMYGTLNLVDPTAAATAVLVDELVARLGVPLDVEIAACLYAGLVTDTGSFRNAATSPAVHRLAARLLATGLRHDVLARELLDSHPFEWLGMAAAVLGRSRLEPDAAGGLGLVWAETRLAELTARGLPVDAAESLIDIVRTVREAEVAAVLKEVPGGGWAVSVRSKGQLDVGAACTALGGGGHRLAAGFTARGRLEPTVAVLRAALAGAPRLTP